MVRGLREWLSTLRWAGEAVVCVGLLFRRKAWRWARVCFWGGVGEVMSNDKILVGGEDLDLERRVILGVCTKYILYLETHARDKVGKWVRLVEVKSITPTLGSAWYGSLPHNRGKARYIIQVVFTLFQTLRKVLRACHVNITPIFLCCLFAPTAVPETQDDNGGLSDKCASILEPRRL